MSQSVATPGGMNTMMPNYDPNDPNAQPLIGAGGVQQVNWFTDAIGLTSPDTSGGSTAPSGGATWLGTIQIVFIAGAAIFAIWFAKDIFDKVT